MGSFRIQLFVAEQDITKYESTGVASGPGTGASQHTNGRSGYRFYPYDRKEDKQTGSTGQKITAATVEKVW